MIRLNQGKGDGYEAWDFIRMEGHIHSYKHKEMHPHAIFLFVLRIVVESCPPELKDLEGKYQRTLERQETVMVIYSNPWVSSRRGSRRQRMCHITQMAGGQPLSRLPT